MPLAPAQIALAAAFVAAVGFALAVGDHRRWRSLLESRFVYGVPWGTLVTVSLVVAFYLLVQGGLHHWSEPLTYPFITWSYLYPTGWLTAGIAHGSPEHLVSNVAGTLAFAPIAEYAWSHYPRDGRDREADGLLARPWIRAVVVFPAALLGVAYATAFFSLGPGLGFSGAVFAIAGFALVTHPLATVVGVVATSGVQLAYQALTQPIVSEAIERGPPAPPEWAGIGFQAHLLGFLLGALVGIALLRRRNRRPAASRVFGATILFGFAQSLWLLVGTVGDDTFVLYRAPGVVLVLLLAAVLSIAVAGSDRPLPWPVSLPTRVRRLLALGWLAVLSLGLIAGGALVVSEGAPLALSVGAMVLAVGLVALPALVVLAPDRWLSSPTPRRRAALIVLLAATVLVAAPSLPLGLTVVDDDAVDGSNELEIEEYTLTYEQNASVEQGSPIDLGEESIESQQDGLLLASDEREIATVAVRDDVLAYAGEETVHVGGLGWRESVDVDRTGWEVVGNETAYAVDLEVGNETTRTFVTDPVEAEATVGGYKMSVAPTEEGFSLRITEDGTEVGETAIPDANESTTVGELQVSTERVDDRERVAVGTDDTQVTVAERETYADEADPADEFDEE
ncbi:rhomboid family intramembrane serine protease [Natronococcus sp. A-GB1]|uniref:rhomboid family intramembrane serine protease n=1 Tax=Natronococcus sp. A-GB1 TaxID=3037648 RepID=UPI00241E662C|nr:rhomboid family intramembrane serine protease [Natronococcus sp. A-GB1]MDG5758145.1 rhomboid family intramembrane serine protease [Natronococcus sp. A-GB1]